MRIQINVRMTPVPKCASARRAFGCVAWEGSRTFHGPSHSIYGEMRGCWLLHCTRLTPLSSVRVSWEICWLFVSRYIVALSTESSELARYPQRSRWGLHFWAVLRGVILPFASRSNSVFDTAVVLSALLVVVVSDAKVVTVHLHRIGVRAAVVIYIACYKTAEWTKPSSAKN